MAQADGTAGAATIIFGKVPFPVKDVNAQTEWSVKEVRFGEADPVTTSQLAQNTLGTQLLAPPEKVILADLNHADNFILSAITGTNPELAGRPFFDINFDVHFFGGRAGAGADS